MTCELAVNNCCYRPDPLENEASDCKGVDRGAGKAKVYGVIIRAEEGYRSHLLNQQEVDKVVNRPHRLFSKNRRVQSPRNG